MAFHRTLIDVTHPDIAPLLIKADPNKGYDVYRTPALVVRFYDLHEARQYQGAGAFGYDCSLVGDGMAAATMETFLREVRKQHLEQSVAAGACIAEYDPDKGVGGATPLSTVLGPDTEKDKVTETGLTRFKFKIGAEWPSGDSKQPLVYDEDGDLIYKVGKHDAIDEKGNSKVPICKGGAIVRINFQVYAYIHKGQAGVRLEPVAVQLLEQGTGSSSGGDSDDVGFDAAPSSSGATDDASTGEV